MDDSSEGVEVEKVVAASDTPGTAPCTPASVAGAHADAKDGAATSPTATPGASASATARVVNPYANTNRQIAGPPAQGPRDSHGGSGQDSGMQRAGSGRNVLVPGVGVPPNDKPPAFRRTSSRLAAAPSSTPSGGAGQATAVVARVDAAHVNKSVQNAIEQAVPKQLNATLTGAALKKAVDSRDFNQSMGTVVKNQLKDPLKKFKDDVRKSAADATADGVATTLDKPLKKLQQVMAQATKAQDITNRQTAKAAASLLQSANAASRSRESKKGKEQSPPDISSILDAKLDAKLEALRTQVNHDGRQNMIALLSELQNFQEGGAGRNLACCISHVLQVHLAYGEEVAAEGPRTPVKKPSASAAGIRSPDSFDRALQIIANGRNKKRQTKSSNQPEGAHDHTSRRMGTCSNENLVDNGHRQESGTVMQKPPMVMQQSKVQQQTMSMQQQPQVQQQPTTVQQQPQVQQQTMSMQQQPQVQLQPIAMQLPQVHPPPLSGMNPPPMQMQQQPFTMTPGQQQPMVGMQQAAMQMQQQQLSQQLPTSQQPAIFGDGNSAQVRNVNGTWSWAPVG
ncbi:unnamed protein product [Ectocarpus sp. 12 AP-2014]